jgi:hypothetical protein
MSSPWVVGDLQTMTSDVRAIIDLQRLRHDLQFNCESSKRCSDLAEISSVPSIKKRLEALARKYQDKALELERELAKAPAHSQNQPERSALP